MLEQGLPPEIEVLSFEACECRKSNGAGGGELAAIQRLTLRPRHGSWECGKGAALCVLGAARAHPRDFIFQN